MKDLLGEAMYGLCQAEQNGLHKVMTLWKEMQPIMEKLKKK